MIKNNFNLSEDLSKPITEIGKVTGRFIWVSYYGRIFQQWKVPMAFKLSDFPKFLKDSTVLQDLLDIPDFSNNPEWGNYELFARQGSRLLSFGVYIFDQIEDPRPFFADLRAEEERRDSMFRDCCRLQFDSRHESVASCVNKIKLGGTAPLKEEKEHEIF